jgi:hypothetical protein
VGGTGVRYSVPPTRTLTCARRQGIRTLQASFLLGPSAAPPPQACTTARGAAGVAGRATQGGAASGPWAPTPAEAAEGASAAGGAAQGAARGTQRPLRRPAQPPRSRREWIAVWRCRELAVSSDVGAGRLAGCRILTCCAGWRAGWPDSGARVRGCRGGTPSRLQEWQSDQQQRCHADKTGQPWEAPMLQAERESQGLVHGFESMRLKLMRFQEHNPRTCADIYHACHRQH